MIHAISIPHHNGSSARPLWSLRSLSLPKRLARANKEAAPIILSGPYADGITDQSHLLPLTVMASHVNLPAADHSEMAPDKDRFPGCFLALRAKTLIKTYCDFGNTYSHKRKLLVKLESLERLVKSTSSAFLLKKRASAARQMLPYSSLEERTLKVLVFPSAKIKHISESAKYSDSFVNVHPLRSLSLPKRPISSLNLLKPARSLSLPKRPALPNNNIDAAPVLRTGFVQQ